MTIAACLALAIGVRCALLWPSLGRLEDPDGYLPIARSIASGGGFSIGGRATAYRPPLYPLALAPLVKSVPGRFEGFAVGGFHLILGALTVLATAEAGRRLGLSRAACLAGSIVVAVDPVLIAQGRSVMTETLAASMVAASLLALARPGRGASAVAGLMLGASSLCRPSLLPGAALIASASLFLGPEGRKRRLGRSALIAAGLVGSMAPWAIRNAIALGEPVWTTTHGGYTLSLANNPAYYDDVLDGPPGAVWSGPRQDEFFRAITRETLGMTEPSADRYLRARAIRFALGHPVDFARASLARLGRFWGVAPSAAVYRGPLRFVVAAWTIPLLILAGVGLCRRSTWRWPAVAVPLMVIGLTAVHAIYWTDLRMRAPLVPALAILAGSGLDGWVAGRRKPSKNGRPEGANMPYLSP